MLINTRTSYNLIYLSLALLCHTTLFSALCECPSSATEDKTPDTAQESNQDKPKSAREQRRERRKARKRQPTVTFNNMTYEQLVERTKTLIEEKNLTMAIKYLKRILTLCKDPIAMATHMLELGDLLFESESYTKAVKVYQEFTKSYPGSTKIEYALYRAIVASWKCTHTPDRDQTPTHETLEMANTFLSRSDIFKTYTAEVAAIRTECYKKIIDSELNVCSFYKDRGQENIVEQRLAMIEEDWGTLFEPTTTMVQAFRAPEQAPALIEQAGLSSLQVVEAKKPTNMADRF